MSYGFRDTEKPFIYKQDTKIPAHFSLTMPHENGNILRRTEIIVFMRI